MGHKSCAENPLKLQAVCSYTPNPLAGHVRLQMTPNFPVHTQFIPTSPIVPLHIVFHEYPKEIKLPF